MKTAIDWLIDQYKKDDGKFMPGVYEQAKEMERVQIVEAHNRGIWPDTLVVYDDGEEYYAENYNNI